MADRVLLGRGQELAVLRAMVESARGGRSDVLVVRGAVGVGKSALLDALTASAEGCQVTRADGIESEMELAYSGLHQVCQPFLDRIGRLPEPQYAALGTAFGLLSGPPPAKFLIGLAVLNLLADAAAERPVVCVVDDAQWIDLMSARVLAFVARRLEAESVVLVVSVREGTEHSFAGLPELEVRGLGDDDARALLDSVLPGPIDPRVRDRIVAETQGNPLALIELPHAWTAAELADGLGAGSLTRQIEDSFVRRLDVLPADTRLLLLTAAAEPLGDATLLWRAAERLGLGDGPVAGAMESGLIAFGQHVRFRHPLVRSAAYRMASPQDRQTVHRALADVTDAGSEPDRRAWHRAQATALPDESVAAELERSARRAQSRGGFFAAGALLERAVELTPDPGLRARRAVAAAIAKRRSGALDSALALLGGAAAGALSPAEAAEVDWLRGEIAFDQGRTPEAARILLDAAGRLEGKRAQDAYLEAISAAIWASGPDTPAVVAAAAGQVAASDQPADLLLKALAVRVTQGYAAAAPQLVEALAQAWDAEIGAADVGGWLWLAGNRAGGIVALELADLESGLAMAARQDGIARRTGALVQLQIALDFRAGLMCLTGDLAAAGRMVDEDRQIAELTGSRRGSAGRMVLEAYRGNERPARELIAELQTVQGQGRLAAFATYGSALLHNGFGRYDVARNAALDVFEQDIVGYGVLVVGELIEAASRTGDTGLVETGLRWLTDRVAITPTDWGLGLAARASALLTADEEEYLRSIECLGRTPVRVEVARGHLLYGEWLRREGRRVDAREQLRTAHDLLTEMGLQAFAERARHELLATGETVRKRTPDTRTDLTAQETQIAALARDGLTNPEIAAQLFISPRTVEWHLRKTFAKLGISSRRQLRTALQ